MPVLFQTRQKTEALSLQVPSLNFLTLLVSRRPDGATCPASAGITGFTPSSPSGATPLAAFFDEPRLNSRRRSRRT